MRKPDHLYDMFTGYQTQKWLVHEALKMAGVIEKKGAWQQGLPGQVSARPSQSTRQTWTSLNHSGPNHLGSWQNAIIEHQTAQWSQS